MEHRGVWKQIRYCVYDPGSDRKHTPLYRRPRHRQWDEDRPAQQQGAMPIFLPTQRDNVLMCPGVVYEF